MRESSLWERLTIVAGAIGLALVTPGPGVLAQAPVVGVEEQFRNLQRSGDPLAFRLGEGDDPYLWTTYGYCKHYQGLARADIGNVPYVFLTRSGSHTDACPGSSDNPGELLVVELASRYPLGERLRSNRLAPNTAFGSTLPPDVDEGVANFHFFVDTANPTGAGWMHPGGVQFIDDVLVVPMQHYCAAGFFDDLRGDGANDCLGNTDVDKGALYFVDVSSPDSPQKLGEFNLTGKTPSNSPHKGGYAAVAVVREPDGRYLFALSNAADQDVAFLRTTTPDDLMNSPLQLESAGFWDPAGLGADQGKWSGWNMINFVRGSDGSLYLLAGDNVCHTPPFCEPFVVGSDWIRLFRVMEASPSSWTLSYVDEKQLETEYPQMGNLKAASGVYVSPTGQLIVYTGHHDRFFQDGVWYVAMGEFRNFDVHVATSDPALPPQLEEIDVNGDGLTETSCSGWAEFYVHAPAGWDDGSSSLGPSVMLDYRDRHFENWDNLAQLPNWNLLPDFPSLNDEISSLRWNLPPGQQLLLYEHAGFGGLARLPIPEGTGRIGNLGSWWNDQISSIHLTALADAGSGYYGSVGTPIPLTRANPCYGADDLDDMSFEWAMSASEDECVPDLDPPCSLVNPTDLRPQVTCSAEGVYWIRLRVTENYGANTDVREDCTYVTVPEPGRIMLLASAISGLVLLSLLRRRWTTGAG